MCIRDRSLVGGPNAEANRSAMMNVALLAGCADRTYYLAPEANSVGVRDVGLLPNRLPGHAAIGDAAARERLERLWGGKLPMEPGLSYDGMLDAASSGRLKALLLVASDPASEGPAGRTALEKTEFVVVQELFLTESAKLADVVLPAVSWAETDGTFTNLERRLQRAPKALGNPNSQAVSDWSIFVHLAQRWPGLVAPQVGVEGKDKKSKKKAEGLKPWAVGTAQAVLDEISRAVPMYDKITWATLGDEGKQVPWETPRIDSSRGVEAPTVLQRRFAVPQRQPAAPRSEGFPYSLVTGRVLYDGGTLFQQTEGAQAIAPSVAVGIHPADAAKEKLSDGQVVTVSSASGQLALTVKLDQAVQPGTLWIPYSLPGAPVETLLDHPGADARVRITTIG